jgi:hypothetical protein
MEELDAVCREAARDLVGREGRPVRPAVVLPLPAATRVTTLPDFPDDDGARFDLLAHFAAEVMRPANAPAYGFVAEAEVGNVDVVVVAYGARNHRARVTAAPLGEDGVGDFTPPEDLDPTAFPFLSPLQHAADAARPGDAPASVLPTRGEGEG